MGGGQVTSGLTEHLGSYVKWPTFNLVESKALSLTSLNLNGKYKMVLKPDLYAQVSICGFKKTLHQIVGN